MAAIPEAETAQRSLLLRALPIVLFAPFGLHYFETFANGWDQAEYVWCVKAGYLPHSPYVLFVLLGRVLHVFLAPAVALTTLSFVAGLASIALLQRLAGTPAAILLGLSTVFVRQVTTQEAYALQLSLALTASFLLVGGHRHGRALGGIAFGCALAAHSASIFLAPALLWLARGSGLLRFVSLALLTGAGMYAIVAWLLPAELELLVYLRGLPPAFDLAPLADLDFVSDSLVGMFQRLTDGGVAVTRGPLATGPVGASVLTLLAAALGAVRLARRELATAVFWALWLGPFFVYELALGWNLDYGTYVVFLMPPLCVFAGEAATWPLSLRRPWGLWLAAAAVVVLAAPSVMQLAEHWGDVEIDRRRHDSPTTLAAIWADESLPAEAVVIQPRSEWNANLLPLHSGRRHVARSGAGLRLFQAAGRWTPMKPDAYLALTTARLTELLRAGSPVFAFEPDPLRGSAPATLDPKRFRWEPFHPVDIGGGRSLMVYRAAALPFEPGRSR
jgi:hypothetical protein